MAAITVIDMAGQRFKKLETIAIANQTAASTAVHKAVAVPPWAHYATVVISGLTLGGTTPSFDFVLFGANVAVTQPPDDGALYDLGGWDGITQKTSGIAIKSVIDIGPNVTVDDTGSASASDRYGVQTALPDWLVYKYTTTDAADDADYDAIISVYFRA